MVDNFALGKETFRHIQLEVEPEVVVIEVTWVVIEASLKALLARAICAIVVQVEGELMFAIKLDLHYYFF